MRLIIPLIIILLGAVVGALVNRLFRNRHSTLKVSLLAGGMGAFVGMVVRDALDIQLFGNLSDTVLAATAGAAILACLANLIGGRTDQ